ncbi:WAT1-related protein At4g19185-like isoform X1 [Vigna unguiculata]|uniref:WAT1-related protein At4g19185-like isoform X1 n=1 Tax=Vigna unguiculata TaxID=3917 RepID=UPI001017146C|nr:WAT1-related protein At4g19185-like isoform X1 [Vigna unguiculata]
MAEDLESVGVVSERGRSWKAHTSMTLSMAFYGGYHVITKVALNDGVNQLVFCFYRDFLAFTILATLAFFLERRTRPPLTKKLLMSFLILGFTGVFGNQLLFLLGLSYTNPTYAAAVQPTIPVFTFMFTLMMGIEKLNLLRYEGWAKAGGTLICVSGAIFMVFYRGPAVIGGNEMDQVTQIKPSGNSSRFAIDIGLDSFQLGVVFLIGNCICMAAYLALQAPLLKKYPANLSVTAYSFFFGVALLVIASFFMVNESTEWILTRSEILAVAYAGTIASALNYGIISWSTKILGPALVSLYNPLQPAFSAILSQIFLGTPIYLGSIIGGTFIVTGLYLVTWASYREKQETYDGVTPNGSWISEPLLHEKGECQSGHTQGPPA